MAVKVINQIEAKPAPEIVHPLLNTEAAQVARGRAFLLNESGDFTVSTLNTQLIPDASVNTVMQVSGGGEDWVSVVKSFTLSATRQGSSANLSMERPEGIDYGS